ncbi:MAG: ABC transporter permease [Saccharofermentans sp.]|jgi:peptide/nickel transport system permease protein|nr:ABC transporter permease [Mageeibacillus sp.]MCI1264328.1 ABC transporter permease [Saccharofermentans sp.]MCI1275592.1 ABC transporter permease [Saccharofermentans sp.]
MRSRAFYITGGILLGICVTAFIMSLVCLPYDPNATDASAKLVAPCASHIFGTDNFGRDVFSRVLSASKYTIFISFAGIAIALVLGVATGLPAGYFGGFTDKSIMLFNNSIMCFPGILLALVAVAVFGASMFNVIWALGLVFAPTFARVCRAGTMEIKERGYILHARVTGVKPVRIMAAHILPNLLPQLLPATVIGLANMTLFESGMSYLGLGVQPPDASFGKMLADSQSYLMTSPWLLVFPSLMLIFYILGLYFLSEGLRVSLSSGGAR